MIMLLLDSAVNRLLRLFPPARRRHLSFRWRYLRGHVPWDTNQTPPEVIEATRDMAPGRALDLGCGTGTNVLYLAERGWEATGVDYVAGAIEAARRKAAARGVDATFYQGDVTRLDELPLNPPYDFLLDIGCFHSLTPEGRVPYARQVARVAAPGALYMLYAGLPRKSNTGVIGVEPEEVARLFTPAFTIERQEIGEDSGGGWRRAWYWFRRGEA